jgi:hypothetical protein
VRKFALGSAARHHFRKNFGFSHGLGPERAPLQVTILVEHEERMQALRLEVAIPGCALLVAMNRALGAVHVQRDATILSCAGLPSADRSVARAFNGLIAASDGGMVIGRKPNGESRFMGAAAGERELRRAMGEVNCDVRHQRP